MGLFDIAGDLVGAGVSAWQGEENRKQQMQIAQMNIAAQREFAQSGLGWRIEDAVKHGIHPLIGAGASSTSFSPVSVASTDYGSMGQDLGRAVKAMGNLDERKEKDAQEATKISLEKGRLENDILKTELASKIARENSPAQIGPPAQVPAGYVPLPRPGPARAPIGDAVPVSDDKLKTSEGDVPQRQNYSFWGIPMKSAPWMSDAQTVQNRHGDLVEELYGLGSVPIDALYTMGQSGWYRRLLPTRGMYWRRASDRNWRPTVENNGMPQP